ncbi:MAG: DUF4351 domain-containing protein [Clostridium sp.]
MDKLKIEDTVFAQAFVKHLEGFKELFNIEGTDFQPVRGEIKEIQIERLSVDFIYEVDEKKLIHFEFQSTNKNSDIYRFLLYDVHLVSEYKKPIETYVIYTNSIKNVMNELTLGSIQYKFNPIYMGNFNADEIILEIKNKLKNGENLLLSDIVRLEFTPLMCSRKKQDVIIEEALNVTTEITDNVRKEQCQTILVALALKFGVEINNELGRKIRMSPLGQKIFNEGIEEGIEKGIEKGIGKGKAILLVNLLNKKFNNISDDLEKKVKALSESQLDLIGLNIFDMNSIDDLKKYIN